MITLKGTKEGITIQFAKELSLEEAREQIAAKLSQAKDFFRDTAVVICLDAPFFSEFEQYLLQTEIKRQLTDSRVEFADQTQQQTSAMPATAPKPKDVFYKGTVRSGSVLRAEGHLVVLGDVNPGAELVAGGDIVVMGTARGILWAGAEGNRSAIVSAARLRPSQIRIADLISRRPDEELLPESDYPEFAEICNNRIYIEKKLRE